MALLPQAAGLGAGGPQEGLPKDGQRTDKISGQNNLQLPLYKHTLKTSYAFLFYIADKATLL